MAGMKDGPDLVTLLGRIQEANADYEAARDKARSASAAETAALNTLNQLQREFDEQLSELKELAPGGSEWGGVTRPE